MTFAPAPVENHQASVTTGILTGGVVYSTTFAALISHGWEWLGGALTALAVAVVPGLIVAFGTHWIQQTGQRRNSLKGYCMEEGLPPALESMRQVKRSQRLLGFVLWGNDTGNICPRLPDTTPWNALCALDDGIGAAARSYNETRAALEQAEKQGREEARAVLISSFSAEFEQSPDELLQRASWGNLAFRAWQRALQGASGKSAMTPDAVFKLVGDGSAEVRIQNDQLLLGPPPIVQGILRAAELAESAPDVISAAKRVVAAFERWEHSAFQLHQQLELVQALGGPRQNTLLRRRALQRALA